MNKFLVLITILIALPLAIVMFTLQRRSPKQPDTITIGMLVWAPFMTINPNGDYEGFDVDVAQELAKRMNKKLVIQDLGSLASCFIALEQNKIDLLISGLDITEQRLKKLSMVQYTGERTTFFEFVFWNEIPTSIKTADDLKTFPNPVICAEAGSGQEKFLDSLPYITKKPMGSVTDMILDVKYGKSLAVILEPPIAARFKKQESALKTIQVPLPPSFQVFGCGIGINKKRPELNTIITKLIQDIKADGTMAMLEKKWDVSC